MTVGDRIKQRRIELEWSQEELAKRAGYYGKPTISKYENAGNDISMKQVSRLAKALGVTTAYLMGWESEHKSLSDTTVSTSDIPAAIDLYASYKNASPETQMAIDLLLKGPQQAALSQRLQDYNNGQTPIDT